MSETVKYEARVVCDRPLNEPSCWWWESKASTYTILDDDHEEELWGKVFKAGLKHMSETGHPVRVEVIRHRSRRLTLGEKEVGHDDDND